MKRGSLAIKQAILRILAKEEKVTYAELERKVNTGYNSVVMNCKELESFGAVTITRFDKHEANGKPYFEIRITTQGREILKKF